jgi:putative SOS response-associated peptidase YedK
MLGTPNKKQMDTWLEPIVFNRDQLDELLAPLKDGRLDIVRVSKNVNNARNNSEDLIYKLDS